MKTFFRLLLFLCLLIGDLACAQTRTVTVTPGAGGTAVFSTNGVTTYILPAGMTFDFHLGNVFAPQFTGQTTFTALGAYTPATFLAYAGSPSAAFYGAGNVGASLGQIIVAGSNSSDYGQAIFDKNANLMFKVDGGGQIKAPKFYSTIGPLVTDSSGNVTTNSSGLPNAILFGADPTGANDSKAAIDAALAVNPRIYLPKGTYKYSGQLTRCAHNYGGIIGDGSNVTTINFTSTAITSCVSLYNASSSYANVIFKGFTVNGPGQSAGSNIDGFYSGSNPSAPYNLDFEDVSVANVSGNGWNITDAFMQRYIGCWAEEIGGNGLLSGGDQSTTVINSGQWFRNITGWALWIQGGSPFIQGFNCGPVNAGGMRFGLASPATYCYPTIIGYNVEPIHANGGAGIQFEFASGPAYLSTGGIYLDTGVTGAYGIRFINLGQGGFMAGTPKFSGTWAGSNYLYADSYLPYGNVFIASDRADIFSLMNATFASVVQVVLPSNGSGNFTIGNPNLTVLAADIGTGTASTHVTISGGNITTGGDVTVSGSIINGSGIANLVLKAGGTSGITQQAAGGVTSVIYDNTTMGAGVGGIISFAGNYLTGQNSGAVMAQIYLSKHNATSGDSTGDLILQSRHTGSGLANALVLNGTDQSAQMPHYGAGAATFDASGNITSVSDARKKDIVGGFSRGLDAVRQLNPITFHWRADSGLSTKELNAGFVAQDVLPVIPEAIGQDKEGFYTFADRPVTAALVNAVKELDTRTQGNAADWPARILAGAALLLAIRANLKQRKP